MRKYLLILLPILLFLSCKTNQSNIKELTEKEYFSAAGEAIRKNDYRGAITNYKKFIKENDIEDEKCSYAQYQIGESYYKLMEYNDAAIEYEKVFAKYSKSPFAKKSQYKSGLSYYKDKSYSRASRIFFNYLEKYPIDNKKSIVTHYLAESLYQLKKFAEAIEYYIKLLKYKDITIDTQSVIIKIARYFWETKNDRESACYYLDMLEFKNKAIIDFEKKIRWSYINKSNGLVDNSISSIYFDGDDLWVGLWIGGVMRFTRSSGKRVNFTTRSGLVSSYVRDINIDRENVWVATFNGVGRYDKQKSMWYNYNAIPGIANQKIKTIKITENKIYFGSLGKGVAVHDRFGDKWKLISKKNGLSGNYIVAVEQDENNMLFGTLFNGLNIYSIGEDKIILKFDSNNGLRENTVKDIINRKNKWWIASYKKGLAIYNKITKVWKSLDLPDNSAYINCIAFKENSLWVGTLGKGVYIYHNEKWGNINMDHGLSSNEITTIEFEEDYVWFGTLQGGISIYYIGKNRYK